MQYTLKGEKENIEKFFSKVPYDLTEKWKLECVDVLNIMTYNYYCLFERKIPFCIQITYQESYKSYDIRVSPTDSARTASYDDEKDCLDLLKNFIIDFHTWASECHIKIAKVND